MIDIENINPVIKSILDSIGVKTKNEIFDFLYQDIYSISNPFEIKDIDVFVSRVKEAVRSNEKILIYGDKDADGVTAASIIYNTLKAVSKNVEAFVPNHDTGYGLSKKVIEEYAKSGTSLIITVDCGISNIEEVAFARELSIDIIVTDHHDIPETLPDAYVIFNPKLKNSGFSSLNYCGCAVAFKLMQAFVFSYTKFYERDVVILDYEINKVSNEIRNIKALKMTNFVYGGEIFAFEKNEDSGYKTIYSDYYEETLSEEEVLEELASYMFEGDRVVLVLTGGIERLKKLLSIYERYEIYLPQYEEVFNLLDLGKYYGNVNLKNIKTLKDFALALNVNIYKYENLAYKDMLIKADIFQRLFYISQEKLNAYMKRECILVALGTIADIIPVIGESRAYVKCALKELRETKHIRYNAIFNKINLLKDKIDTQTISWRFAPFINAAGRMGKPEYALRLLTCETEKDALYFSDEIFNMNEERKSLTDENFSAVADYINKSRLYEDHVIIVKSEKVEQGLTGLIAGRVVSEYGKAAVIISENKELGICVGSARSRGLDNVRDMLEEANECLEKYGGHKNAAGFSINSSNFERFSELAKEYAEKKSFGNENETKKYTMKLDFKNITLSLAETLELFEPYGYGNEEPIFASYNVCITDIKKIEKNKKTHLMLDLSQNKKTIRGVIWNVEENEYIKLKNSNFINITYKIRVNRFNGLSDVRIYIESYEIN